MKRIQVLEKGKVIPGQEDNFKLASHMEGQSLKKIDAAFREEEPDLYKDIPPTSDWDREGARSLVAASKRFGDGSFCMEFDDNGTYLYHR